ncbi:hypothetical protein QL285_008182 [Trifolium repens]|nr:hypothetical protein QL285_008182 [Trifolium repens]
MLPPAGALSSGNDVVTFLTTSCLSIVLPKCRQHQIVNNKIISQSHSNHRIHFIKEIKLFVLNQLAPASSWRAKSEATVTTRHGELQLAMASSCISGISRNMNARHSE